MALTRSNARTPTLHVLKQTSLSEEKVTKCGKTRTVSVVVKNSPFQLSVALDGSITNLNQLAFDMSLIYDRPGLEDKEVSYVSQKPIDYKTILNDVGDEICFDVKIKVLSSHHEDNFFRLKVMVWDPSNKQFPILDVTSQAIKVISKPMNQRKSTKRAAPTRRTSKSSPTVEQTLLSQPTSVPTIQTSFNMEASLLKLDNQQQHTIQLLNKILSSPASIEPPAKRIKVEEPSPLMDFESAFSSLLRHYSNMTAEEKAERITKIVRNLPVKEREQLEELCDLLAHAGVNTAALDLQISSGLIQDNYNDSYWDFN